MKKNKKVIYTCVTGGYDFLKNFPVIDDNYDYVCFTDSHIESARQWEKRPLQFSKLDMTRNARWHKLHPHILFPDYEESIYIDASIYVTSRYLYERVEALKADNSMILAIHPKNNCIYQEISDCLKNHKDDSQIMHSQINLIRKAGYPAHNGLSETGGIYRKHHDKKVIQMMDEWWKMIVKHSKRDQLSLHYILWKNNFPVVYFDQESLRLKTKDFWFFPHNDFVYQEIDPIVKNCEIGKIYREKFEEVTNTRMWKTMTRIRGMFGLNSKEKWP